MPDAPGAAPDAPAHAAGEAAGPSVRRRAALRPEEAPWTSPPACYAS
ncbi:hypothetical protein [Actinomadura sediminis]|uniref:Uncharacterized protein n=1 Tax=Actinomadura sediminis TaxID=1038904 RepID=A0ABW3EVN5_9ACTN